MATYMRILANLMPDLRLLLFLKSYRIVIWICGTKALYGTRHEEGIEKEVFHGLFDDI